MSIKDSERSKRWAKLHPDKTRQSARLSRQRKLNRLASKPYPDNGRCELCGEPETKQTRGLLHRLCFDHCHATGAFRGWLCGNCNKGLGSFRDNPVLLRRAAEYIEDAVLLS